VQLLISGITIDNCQPKSRNWLIDATNFLKQDPRYPSLHFKKVGLFWSVRVGIHYRALAIEEDGDMTWFWIGTHAEYDHLLRGN
jgi:hypothetical protein